MANGIFLETVHAISYIERYIDWKKNMAELRPVGTQACKDDFED